MPVGTPAKNEAEKLLQIPRPGTVARARLENVQIAENTRKISSFRTILQRKNSSEKSRGSAIPKGIFTVGGTVLRPSGTHGDYKSTVTQGYAALHPGLRVLRRSATKFPQPRSGDVLAAQHGAKRNVGFAIVFEFHSPAKGGVLRPFGTYGNLKCTVTQGYAALHPGLRALRRSATHRENSATIETMRATIAMAAAILVA